MATVESIRSFWNEKARRMLTVACFIGSSPHDGIRVILMSWASGHQQTRN